MTMHAKIPKLVKLIQSSDPVNYEIYKAMDLPREIRLKVWREFMREMEYLMPYEISQEIVGLNIHHIDCYFNILDFEFVTGFGIDYGARECTLELYESSLPAYIEIHPIRLFRLIYQKIVLA